MATTQQLALRSELLKVQTLTATSDNTQSWGGFGSALTSLWQQLHIPASVLGTLTVTIYLGLIVVLQNTTPALYGLELYNQTYQYQANTTAVFEFNKTW